MRSMRCTLACAAGGGPRSVYIDMVAHADDFACDAVACGARVGGKAVAELKLRAVRPGRQRGAAARRKGAVELREFAAVGRIARGDHAALARVGAEKMHAAHVKAHRLAGVAKQTVFPERRAFIQFQIGAKTAPHAADREFRIPAGHCRKRSFRHDGGTRRPGVVGETPLLSRSIRTASPKNCASRASSAARCEPAPEAVRLKVSAALP